MKRRETQTRKQTHDSGIQSHKPARRTSRAARTRRARNYSSRASTFAATVLRYNRGILAHPQRGRSSRRTTPKPRLTQGAAGPQAPTCSHTCGTAFFSVLIQVARQCSLLIATSRYDVPAFRQAMMTRTEQLRPGKQIQEAKTAKDSHTSATFIMTN